MALALATDSLYATYVELAWDLKDTIVATGRVVRADGAVTVPQKSVSMKVAGKTSFGAAAKTVLKRLVSEEMRLQGLPA
nr:hypothetical protein [Gemmatimonadaceae bacterium]